MEYLVLLARVPGNLDPKRKKSGLVHNHTVTIISIISSRTYPKASRNKIRQHPTVHAINGVKSPRSESPVGAPANKFHSFSPELKVDEVGLNIASVFILAIKLLCDIRFLTFYVIVLFGHVFMHHEDFRTSLDSIRGAVRQKNFGWYHRHSVTVNRYYLNTWE
jgi:hypothetical protein